jgi:hypothetical protein
MASPAPVVASFYMVHFEQQALRAAPQNPGAGMSVTCLWQGRFQKHLNNIHPNMRFSMKMEEDSMQPYLHVMINRKLDGTMEQTVYRKPIHTDFCLYATSHHHPLQKYAVLSTLV